MKTFMVEMSEDQMKMIRASILKVLNDENKNPGLLNENEYEELDMIASMVLDALESDEEVVHGFCY